MLIAQTGSNTLAPIAEPQGSAAVSNLWWMLPLAAAIFALAVYLRPRRSVVQPATKSNKNSDRKSATRDRVASAETVLKDSSTSDHHQSATSNTKAAKKKKSSKKKIQPTVKQTAKPTVVASLDSVATLPAIQNSSTVPSELPESRPVNAIFEPLRDAVKERKRQKYGAESFDQFESNDSSRQREPDLVSQLFGGKFERIVPKASIRSYANRWPAAEAQQVKLTPGSTTRPQPIATAIPAAVSDPVPVTSAPEMGLKSFVSKVKKSDDSSSE